MGIAENINNFLRTIPPQVKLVAVSKTKPNRMIMEAYEGGHKIFGENRVQDLARKAGELPVDIEWHFIGHLQTNKVKYISPFVSLIQSVDSLKVLSVINSEAMKNRKVQDCLLQIHIASEEHKFGFGFDEIEEMLESDLYKRLKNIRLVGLMGMATFTDNTKQIRSEFRMLAETFKKVKLRYFAEEDHFKEISMGMSDDYMIAVEEGSTMVRIGSTIFGSRNFS